MEFYSKNKFEKLEHLVGFIIRIYHDARSPERQIHCLQFTHLNRGSVGFTRLSHGSTAQERLRTPILQVASSDDSYATIANISSVPVPFNL